MKGKHRQPLSLASPCNKCNSNRFVPALPRPASLPVFYLPSFLRLLHSLPCPGTLPSPWCNAVCKIFCPILSKAHGNSNSLNYHPKSCCYHRSRQQHHQWRTSQRKVLHLFKWHLTDFSKELFGTLFRICPPGWNNILNGISNSCSFWMTQIGNLIGFLFNDVWKRIDGVEVLPIVCKAYLCFFCGRTSKSDCFFYIGRYHPSSRISSFLQTEDWIGPYRTGFGPSWNFLKTYTSTTIQWLTPIL